LRALLTAGIAIGALPGANLSPSAAILRASEGSSSMQVQQSKLDGPLARYIPRRELAFYLEFDGLDAHAAAWRASALYKLLNETKLGALLEDLAAQAIEVAERSTPADKRLVSAEVLEAFKHCVRSGFAVAVVRDHAGEAKMIVVLRQADRPELRGVVEALASARSRSAAVRDGKGKPGAAGSPEESVTRLLAADSVWWVEKGALVIAPASLVDSIDAVIAGAQPSAVDHPLRTKLAKPDGEFESVAIGFFDMSAVPLPERAAQLGLGGLKRFELRFGFQEDAIVTDLRVVAPEPRRGLLTLLDQRPFGIDSLPPLPAGTTGFAVLSIDPASLYDQLDHLLNVTKLKPEISTGTANVLADRGVDLRRDLCAQLGPKFAVYAQMPEIVNTETVAAMWIDRLASFAVSAQVHDEKVLAGAIDPLIVIVNQALKRQIQLLQRRRLLPPNWSVEVRKAAEPRGYKLEYVNSPPQLLGKLKPRLIFGRDQLVIGCTASAAERALKGGDRWQAAGAFLPVIKHLPAQMIYLSLQDPRVWTPLFVESLPIAVRQINAELAMAQARAGKTPDATLLRIDPDMIPAAADLTRLMFPSSTSLVVDRQGARMLARESIFSPTSPLSIGVAAVLSLPAIESALDSARRAKCLENMKQIALAMHSFHATANAFPRPAIADANGKPLLSWRVAILPYIGQKALYDKFKPNEPWDSPHNEALLQEMPALYRCPDQSKAQPFTTTYRIPVGKGALFENDRDIGVAAVTDGTSNTIMIIEAAQAVPWTKPDDLAFDAAAAPSLLGAGSPHPGGFHVSFADGRIQYIKTSLDLNTFRTLITRAGGEVVSPLP
jgi:hypothetical protein